MSTNYIHQWAIALGFDASAVEKGIAQTTRVIAQASERQRKAAKPYEDALKAQNSALKEQIRLRGLLNTVSNRQTRQSPVSQTVTNPVDRSRDRVALREARREDAAARRAEALQTRKDNMQASVALLRTNVSRIQDPTRRDNLNERLNLASSSITGAASHNQLTGVQGQQLKIIRAETQGLIGDQKRLNDHLARSKWLATGFARSFKNLATSYIGVFGALAGLQAVFRTAKALDSIKASMLAGSGSAEAAAKNFDYVRSEAKRLGLDLASTAKSYSQMSIAAKLAGLSTETTRGIFEGVTEASTAFGLSAEDNEGVLRALTQMLSKNVISAEELRGQMGDRMPIAMGVMAKALKMSTKELDKQMRSGKLIATEVLPKWAKQMKITAREGGALAAGMNTIGAAQNRLNTAWTEAIEMFSKGGGKFGFVTALNDMADVLTELKPLFQMLGFILSVSVKAMRELLNPITSVMNAVMNTTMKVSDKLYGTSFGSSSTSPSKSLSSTLSSSPNSSSPSSKVTNNNTINFTSTKANAKDVRKEMEDLMQLHWTGLAAGPA